MSRFQRVLKVVLLSVVGFCLAFVIQDLTVWFTVQNTRPSSVKAVILQINDSKHPTASTTSKNTTKPDTMVVILTYMRSGSSFTGEIIQRSPDTFYVFEPLWTIQHLHTDNIKPIYLAKGAGPKEKHYKEILENFLTCDMKNIDIHTLRQYHMKNSLDTKRFHKCLADKPGVLGIVHCLPLIERPCRESRLSCVKTIRFPMADMKSLMDSYPGIKILHLMRDPRSTLFSQRRVGEFAWKNLTESARNHCKRVENDLNHSVEMKMMYPGRIATLRYEDLADKSDDMLEKIYKFLGLELTKEIREYVHNITTVSEPQCGALCTRRNAKEVLAQWRKVMPFSYVSQIDGICESLYKKLGYLPMKNESSLRNLAVPVLSMPHVDPLRLGGI